MRAITFLILTLLALPFNAIAGTWAGFMVPDAYSFALPSGEVRQAACGDLNGDGYPEVVVAQASYLQVQINNHGTLTAGAKYTLGSISRVIIVDLNRDGRLDAVAVGGVTAVLLGKGDGTFQTPTAWAGVGDDAAVGDFNRDGYPDLVTVSVLGVQVRLNDGHGSLGEITTLAVMQKSPRRIAVADINDDGAADLVGSNGQLMVLPGRGDGTFGSAIVTNVDASGFAVGDANRDGISDMYYAGKMNGASSAGVLLGNGDGTFRQVVASAVGINAQAVSLGDFDGDGLTDMAVSSFGDGILRIDVPSGLTILLGNADGTFRPGKQYAFAGVQNPAIDMDGDGKLDLVIGGTAIAFGNGDGTFKAVEQVAVGGVVDHVSMVGADLNRDGVIDFALVGAGNQVEVLRQFGDKWSAVPVAGVSGWHVVAGDFDGDGYPDLAAASGGNYFVSIARGSTDGSFETAKTFPLGTSGEHYLASGKLNTDKFDDLVVVSGDKIELLMGRGDGYFAPPTDVTLQNGDGNEAVVADVNLDGTTDVVVKHDFAISVLMGDATGRYLDQRYVSAAGKIGGMRVQDINGDARPDLVYSAMFLGKVYVLWGDGNGGFASGGSYAVKTPGSVAVADINGDGLPDLVVCSDNGGLATLLGTAQHTFSAATYWYANVGQSHPVAADVNGDGVTDIVTFDALSAVSLFVNKGWTAAASQALATSAMSLDFGQQRIWSSSSVQSFKLSNSGNLAAPLQFAVTGDFIEWDTCGGALPVGAACMVYATFKPVHVGAQSGLLTIRGGSAQQVIVLVGTGEDIIAVPGRPGRGERTMSNPSSELVGISQDEIGGLNRLRNPLSSENMSGRTSPSARYLPQKRVEQKQLNVRHYWLNQRSQSHFRLQAARDRTILFCPLYCFLELRAVDLGHVRHDPVRAIKRTCGDDTPVHVQCMPLPTNASLQ